jgi:hypothetical protein
MLALEKPHWGVSGVPFMNKTTGEEATALSMAERTSSESSRAWKGVRKRAVGVGRVVLARVAARKACYLLARGVGEKIVLKDIPKELRVLRTFCVMESC